MALCRKLIQWALLTVLVLGFCLDLGIGHEGRHSGSCTSQALDSHDHHHNHHQRGRGRHRHHQEEKLVSGTKLPEELAEEEDMKLYGFGFAYDHEHGHDHRGHRLGGGSELSGLGLWLSALGCSFLVSMASLICLIILPLIFVQGKPSKTVVDSLALFGAGAMLGDAFLHQLPHAFGGKHSHSHGNHVDHDHDHDAGIGHGHSHSFADLSTGISILAGIVLFLLVEKVVRYVEENSRGANSWTNGHHHHHHSKKKKLKDDAKDGQLLDEGRDSDGALRDSSMGNDATQSRPLLRKRNNGSKTSSVDDMKSLNEKAPAKSSNLVFGYLNLFSDAVHNFTDGMALGSAFLLYGSVGGWSRTLFLLAHELPQEIGDFGILIRSGFSTSKALFFNFLSALVALVGTALALLWGKDPGQSSLIEGFTAGGFIYIAIAGVLAEMNNSEKTTLRSTIVP
ncbi:IAA-alanine resistance protein 1-like [Prosopis cineraria]|uniref:IAA-alanine resistance protein 1-like n=1 Tax=Prosopis cineraria TaxID=364024 RepID=UPI00240F0E6D|nr:IAA-alanine resistance protein 1-like [Prosopis cineraria]